MTRMNRLIGLPVLFEGKRVGRVSAASLSPCGTRLEGLFVQSGLAGAKWVPGEQIRVLGEVSVVIGSTPQKRSQGKLFIPGKVSDTSGMRLGSVTDARLDSRTLSVDALEITFGPIDDLLQGRRWVQSFTVQPGSGDVVIPCTPKE